MDFLIGSGIDSFSISDPICSADIMGPKMKKSIINIWLSDFLEILFNKYWGKINLSLCPRLHLGLENINLLKDIPAVCPDNPSFK